jgi:hypothetical protein
LDITQELLRLETAKHRALLECDSQSYHDRVVEQVHLVNSGVDPAAAAQNNPEIVGALSRLTRLNTVLLLNVISTSPVFAANRNGYTSSGTLDRRPAGRVSVEV